MTKDDRTDADGAEQPTWRELAVARSLDSARTRAENRVQRFLDAATELMAANEGKDFTVQEVVERSGQSLRSFYQYFGGKHELLLALFEEAIRVTVEHLAAKLEDDDLDELGRLRVFVVEYYRLCQSPRKRASKTGVPSPVLVDFALQLLTAHPAEASRAFTPLVTLFDGLLADAARAKVIRSDVDLQQVSGSVLQSVMFNSFAAIIVGRRGAAKKGSDPAEAFWDVIVAGLGA